MNRRLKVFEQRLARVAAWRRGHEETAEEERALHEGRQTVAAMIREGIEHAGLDPDASPTLRRLEAMKPPAPPPRRRVEPDEPFLAEIHRLVARLRGRPPDLANASPMALLAYYCFGDGVSEAPA
jgi:hypothetical protein